MDNRYIRNIPALSEAECAAVQGKTVAVIGCGGLGGYLIEFLARIGIGHIRCVDGDVFEESNLNRQLLSTVSLLGANKAASAVKRIQAINPVVQATAYPVFLDPVNARELIAGCDAVLDGLDNLSSRRILADACKESNIPYIFGAIDGWFAQAAICMPGDDLLETLYPKDAVTVGKSALSFTPALCAAMQASLCIRWLTGRKPQTGIVHLADLLSDDYEQVCISKKKQ